jgi:zinc protease
MLMWLPFVALGQEAPTSTLNPTQQPNLQLKAGFRQYCLDSGLQVVVQPFPGHPIIHATTVIDAGSAFDPTGKEGLAHLVEHLYFRSGAPGVRAQVEALGGFSNAYTTHDEVVYEITVPAGSFSTLMTLEERLLSAPVTGVSEALFQAERAVVTSELRQNYDHRGIGGVQAVVEALFPDGDPYRRPIIGTEASLAGLTLSDATQFGATNYRSERATLVLSGAVTFQQVEQALGASKVLAARRDGAKACKPRTVAPLTPPVPTNPDAVLRVDAPTSGAVGVLAWAVPTSTSPASFPHLLAPELEDVLAEPESELLTGPDRTVTNVSCGVDDRARVGIVVCTFRVRDPSIADDAAREVSEGAGKLSSDAFLDRRYSARRLDAALGLIDVHENAAVGVGSAAADRAVYAHRTGRLDFAERALGELTSADEAPAVAYANQWIKRGRAALGAIVSAGNGSVDTTVRDVPAFVWAPDLAATAPPPPKLTATTHTLPNGMDVWVLPWGQTGIVHESIVIPGGPHAAPDPGLGFALWAATEQRYLTDYNYATADLALVMYGTWRTYWEDAYLRDSMYLPSVSGEAALAMLAKDVRQLAISPAPSTFWDEYKAALAWDWGYASTHADRLRTTALWGNGAASAYHEDHLALASAASAKAVRALGSVALGPDRAVAVFVGDISDPAAYVRFAEAHLGSWKATGGAPPPPKATTTTPERAVWVIHTPEASQAELTLQCWLGPTEPTRDAAYRLTAEVVRARGWEVLREQSGLTYDFSAWTEPSTIAPTMLHVEAAVEPLAAGGAVRLVLDAVKAVSAGLPGLELDGARASLGRALLLDTRTSGQVMEQLTEAAGLGFGPDWVTERAARVAAADPADVKAAGAACAGHEVVTLIGPAEPIEASLTAAGVPFTRFEMPPEPAAVTEGRALLRRYSR